MLGSIPMSNDLFEQSRSERYSVRHVERLLTLSTLWFVIGIAVFEASLLTMGTAICAINLWWAWRRGIFL